MTIMTLGRPLIGRSDEVFSLLLLVLFLVLSRSLL